MKLRNFHEVVIINGKRGVGPNFPVGFYPWTLFGVSRSHQLPDSWNLTGPGICPAPMPTPEAPDNMANSGLSPYPGHWSPRKGQHTHHDL